jgi:CheY-like chemotaxis protein
LAGKDVFDVRRMMKILVIYQILMVSGATASMCDNGVKWLFFGVSVISLLNIYRYAHSIFEEAKEVMPQRANVVINWISFIFYLSWSGFGVSWFFSPNGIDVISNYTTKALYAFFDILSKNVYSMLGWYLRWYIIRKFDNPEEFVEQYSEEEDKQISILLVEDNPIYSHYFNNILIQHGCVVDVSKNLEELLLMTANMEKQYDIIFMNKTIAIENSYKIMYEIRKTMFMLPVIVYGRDINEYDMMNRNNTGIDDFLIAPFPDDTLKKKLLQWSRRASVNAVLINTNNSSTNKISDQIDIVIKSLNNLRSTKQFVS